MTTGLAEGYWHDEESGDVWAREWVKAGRYSHLENLRLCSYACVVRGESNGFGYNWAICVEIRDQRKVTKEVVLRKAEASTDTAESIRVLVDAGLVIYAPQNQNNHRLILDGLLGAEAKLSYRLTKPGWFKIAKNPVFATPSEVIRKSPNDELVLWGGDENMCKTSRSGTRDSWGDNVCRLVDGNPVPTVCIGVMLASPVIPYLPEHCETNTGLHFVSKTSGGKTTSTRCGCTVWGLGATTEVEGTFLKSWKATGNASELSFAGHNHIGLALDELKAVDAKASVTLAYDFSLGRSKHRMAAKGGSRESHSWSEFFLSSGEVTLAERANDQSFRRQIMDAGAEVRVINIPTDANIFPSLHGYVSGAAFAQALGSASMNHYGHAGPDFVSWIIANEDGARRRVEAIFEVWSSTAVRCLKAEGALDADINSQALRIVSRLGPMAAGGALAADVLAFPWSASEEINSEHLGPAGRAMIWAFLEVFKLWLSKNGSKVSTQEAEAMSQLRAFYLGAAPGAFPITVRNGLEEEDEQGHSETVGRCGFMVMSGRVKSRFTDRNGVERDGRFEGGTLEYVDFIPSVLRQKMNWTEVTRRGALNVLKNQEFLITGTKNGQLTFTRRVDGRLMDVHRVKGKFFEGGE
jgi:putative DNA primase/helicase